VQSDELTHSLVQRNTVRTAGTEALDLLLKWTELEYLPSSSTPPTTAAATAGGGGGGGGGVEAAFSPVERNGLVKALPGEVGGPLARVVEAANGADPEVGWSWGSGYCRGPYLVKQSIPIHPMLNYIFAYLR
jgi:hypothetical protein